jgi:hypothetical protein
LRVKAEDDPFAVADDLLVVGVAESATKMRSMFTAGSITCGV